MKKPVITLLALALAGVATAARADSPKVGDTAPGFSLLSATRDSIAWTPLTLQSMLGKDNVVIAFYPADWSGGCTKEVCSLRDNFAALGALNARVVGISGDYVFSHFEWAKHHELPFTLASDHKHEVAKAYGVYDEPSGHDRRTVFVVAPDGKIAYEDLAYSVRDDGSFDKLKAALAKLK